MSYTAVHPVYTNPRIGEFGGGFGKPVSTPVPPRDITVSDPDHECPVCYENSIAFVVPCGHRFCGKCPAASVGAGRRACPICRGPIQDIYPLAGVNPSLIAPLPPKHEVVVEDLDDWNAHYEVTPFILGGGERVVHNYGHCSVRGMVTCLSCGAHVKDTQTRRHKHARSHL